MIRKNSLAAAFAVGDKVWVSLPDRRVCGKVIEDRGPIGVSGRQLYRVEVPNDPYAPSAFLLAEEGLQPATDDETTERLESDAIIDYLIHGGLVAILQRNTNAPVWLRRGPYGNVTFTFLEGYSRTGGIPPPSYALHGERIFEPKAPAVIEFLKSFGLSDVEAQQVVRAVETA